MWCWKVPDQAFYGRVLLHSRSLVSEEILRTILGFCLWGISSSEAHCQKVWKMFCRCASWSVSGVGDYLLDSMLAQDLMTHPGYILPAPFCVIYFLNNRQLVPGYLVMGQWRKNAYRICWTRTWRSSRRALRKAERFRMGPHFGFVGNTKRKLLSKASARLSWSVPHWLQLI